MSAVFRIDASHSSIEFSLRSLATADVRGRFVQFRGTIAVDDDVTRSAVQVEIDAISVHTDDGRRDDRLRILDDAAFPSITFASRRVEDAPPGRLRVSGALTFQGATREVTLDVEPRGSGNDPQGRQRIAFSARGSIEAGGDAVEVRCEVEAIRATPAATRGASPVAPWIVHR